MVFEDIQWADASLLDFIEYLIEWSRDHRIFVLTLGRPELGERRPGWGSDKRNLTSIYLDPLQEGSMDELLTGLVPGLPSELSAKVLERGGGTALRGRDRPHAARPGARRRGPRRVPAVGRRRGARGAGDLARPHRGSPGRAHRRGAAHRAGRVGARQDVRQGGAWIGVGAHGRAARAVPVLADAQGDPDRPG